MKALSLCNLSIGYASKHQPSVPLGSQWNAVLAPNTVTTLVGPNGTGKSTLLKTITGICPPLAGDIFWDGLSLLRLTPIERAQIISVVLTNQVINLDLCVREFVSLGRYPYTNYFGTLTPHDNEEIKKALEQVGISALAHKKLRHISDGERQKAHIAKALAQETPLIVMDEPTAHLDYPSKQQIMQLLCSITQEEKKTLLLSSHDLHIALSTTPHLWLITPQGQLYTGTVDQLKQQDYGKDFLQL